jgi:hypothetical protein
MKSALQYVAAVSLLIFLLLAKGLSAAEPVVLFDGENLDQWDIINCEAVVQDGAILIKSGNGLVQAKNRYTDFILEYEWKALKPERWDSGVYFRYEEVPEGRPWPGKYQVNLRFGMEGDLVGFKDGMNPVELNPAEWNRFVLTVKGTKASLQVNGKDAWSVDGVKVANGHVAIQSEVPGGGQFLFRNIRVTDLTE